MRDVWDLAVFVKPTRGCLMGRLTTEVRLTVRRRRRVLLGIASLCLLALGPAPQASAAGPGFFSPTGSMSVRRASAVAAPLPGGRVLVAGGSNFDGIAHTRLIASAEVFDPATGTFSPAGIGSLSVARDGAAAAPLPDGRVLVVGGCCSSPLGGQLLSSAEVFDAATGSFTSTGIGSMSGPRFGAVAAPLPDGRVLVAGGSDDNNTLSSAEIFNPATGTFSAAGIGSMSVPRSGAAAAPLPDGRVLVVGGGSPSAYSSAEIFDPATNTFSSAGIGSLSVARSRAAAASLPDGVLVAGGFWPSAEVFNPATGTFSSAGIGSMCVPRVNAAAAPLPGGRVLVAGGDNFDTIAHTLASAEIFAAGSAPASPTCGAASAPPSASCRGRQATMVGTDGPEQISGTPAADVIAALGGKDKLSGLAGQDVICGGKGNDTLKGGGGKDQLTGQKGNDKLYGQKGNDKLSGKAGNDTLKGGPGKDTLKGGAGKDKQVQ
jgi:Ca2+-binding RTX toxin-like protein